MNVVFDMAGGNPTLYDSILESTLYDFDTTRYIMHERSEYHKRYLEILKNSKD